MYFSVATEIAHLVIKFVVNHYLVENINVSPYATRVAAIPVSRKDKLNVDVGTQFQPSFAVERKNRNSLFADNRAGMMMILICKWNFLLIAWYFSRIPTKCHHQNIHDCHPGDCPPCTKICDLKNDTANCEHLCKAICHDSVKVMIKDPNFKPAGPWDVPKEKVNSCSKHVSRLFIICSILGRNSEACTSKMYL